MLIVCPNCASSYQVEPQLLGLGGCDVRCVRCQEIWFAAMSTPVPALGAVDNFNVVDNDLSISVFDGPSAAPEVEADPAGRWGTLEAEPAEQPEAAVADEPWPATPPQPEQQPEPAPVVDREPEPSFIDDIDLQLLQAEIEAERIQQMAEADRVLSEVTHEAPLPEAAPPEVTPLVPPLEPMQAEAPPLVPLLEPMPPEAPEATAAEAHLHADIESFPIRRARRAASHKPSRWTGAGLPALILALVAANAVLFAWRGHVVRLLPQTASLYGAVGLPVNLRGLAFQNIKTTREMQDGVGVLVVEGSIVNVAGKAVEVPRLRLAARNDSKNEIYTWTTLPTRSVLGPTEELAFRSRLASPPEDARDVIIRFFNRRDMVAALR
jgi:predicted Zn finger-like uncharacterized protein